MSEFGLTFGIIAGGLNFISYAFYITSILRGKTKPNRASWWIWLLSGIIIGFSYHFSGARQTIWVPVSEVIGPFVVAILSIWKGTGGWGKLDKISLAGAAASLILWYATGVAILALVFNLVVDFFGALPTIAKSFKNPYEEDLAAWGFVFIANILNIFAAEAFTFNILIHPIYMAWIAGVIFFVVFLRRLYLKKKKLESTQNEIL